MGQTQSDRHALQIGSIEALRVPNHDTYAYSASKAGMHHLSRHLAGRLGWDGITSNTLACGSYTPYFWRHESDLNANFFRAI